MKSGTWPLCPPDDSLTQIPHSAPEHQARTDRHRHRARLRDDPREDENAEAQQDGHDRGTSTEEAECEAGIEGQRQTDGAP